jgi:hypothetical protein
MVYHSFITPDPIHCQGNYGHLPSDFVPTYLKTTAQWISKSMLRLCLHLHCNTNSISNIRQVNSCLYGTVYYSELPPSPHTYTLNNTPPPPQKKEKLTYFSIWPNCKILLCYSPFEKRCIFLEKRTSTSRKMWPDQRLSMWQSSCAVGQD